VVALVITVSLLLAVVAAVKFRTFRWVAAILLAIAFIQAHPVLVAVAVVVAVALRAAWHGRRAVRVANEARRAREDELRARCVEQDRLVRLGDPAGTWGLYPPA
jgi:membrane protein implicated in regulation of membrane protease activity